MTGDGHTHTHLAPHGDPSVVKTDTHMQALQSKQGVFASLSCMCQTMCFLQPFPSLFILILVILYFLSTTEDQQNKARNNS